MYVCKVCYEYQLEIIEEGKQLLATVTLEKEEMFGLNAANIKVCMCGVPVYRKIEIGKIK